MVGRLRAVVQGAPTASCADVRVGLTHMAGVPLRATAAEDALRGSRLDADTIAAAAEQAAEGTDPPADLNATADYKRHLARVLCKRALRRRPRRRDARGRRRTSRGAGRPGLPGRPRASPPPSSSPTTLEQPLLLEGEAGVGKTEVAQGAGAARRRAADPAAVPRGHRRPPRRSTTGTTSASCSRSARPRRARTRASSTRARSCCAGRCWRRSRPTGRVVLLIDEIDRADDEFEAFLLELLSDFQVTIPELGTITARRRPLVVLTSNRTRELHDALKRRCLYHWIDYPDRASARPRSSARGCPACPRRSPRGCARRSRGCAPRSSTRLPGVGETIAWARALLALGPEDDLDATLGVALKVREDIERVREQGVLAGCLKRSAGARVAGARRDAARARRAGRGGGGARGAPGARRRRRRGRASSRTTRCARRSARRTPTYERFDARVRRGVRRARCSRATIRSPSWARSRAAVLPRVGVPAEAALPETLELEATPRRLERRGAAAREGLRRLHGRRARRRAAAARAPRRAAGRPASAAGRARCGGAATSPTCARPRARRCARAASCSSAAGARRRGARAGSSWCSTCRARWRPTRACCCSTCRRASRHGRASRRSPSARG